jgi:hypothetical protein
VSDPRRANLRDFHRARGRGRAIELPAGVVRVDRATPWGNQYRIGQALAPYFPALERHHVIELYRKWLDMKLFADPEFIEPLRGKRLACWCAPDLACHVDVLLEVLDRTAVPS